MLKIGIMTFHDADNYGAVLQSFALTKAIKKIGGADVHCEIIDYKNPPIENRYRVKRISEFPKIKTKIKHCLLRSYKVANRRNYNKFREDYLMVSERQYTLGNIKEANDVYDVFITGSDQVWNGLLTGDDNSYFLDFVHSEKTRISYAASIGAEEYAFKNPKKFKDFLRGYDAISVREDTALKGIVQLGISNVVKVLDPTFLLATDDYDKLILENVRRHDKYILLYVIAIEKEVYEFASKLATTTGCSNKLKFYIVDVRDIQSFRDAMHGVDYIFHAAALKQVPSCEFFPIEAVKTNVVGTENVLTAAIEAGVKKVICLSTDKAAYPVNAMGTSKAMMEKVVVAKSRTISPDRTSICCTRYGNVMCSRGSVIPLFVSQIKDGKDLTVTEPTMTRFIMSLEEAVELVVFTFQNADSGDIMVQKAPACTIEVLAQAVKELFHADNEIKVIGIRHGEKMYETLLTNEECGNAIDMGNFYRVPCDKRDLNYDKYFKDGDVDRNPLTEFNSSNTELLNVEQVKEKLLSLKYIRDEIAEWESR